MLLTINSDASYLVLPKARSRGSHYFCLVTPLTIDNGAVLIEYKIIHYVVSSAAEVETHGILHNAPLCISLRNILISMGHPQPPTTINTDNKVAEGFTDNNIQLKKSKSWDMKLHWLQHQQNVKKCTLKWKRGPDNGADYFTKVNHSLPHHCK